MKLRNLFGGVKKSSDHKKGGSLFKVIDSSYGSKKSQRRALKDEGYIFDDELSNHNQQVYFHPGKKKLVTSVTGTHNFSDYITDARLLGGNIKKTGRYKEAERTLKDAKTKYHPDESTVVGHSLGGAIASRIASDSDKIINYNSAVLPGDKKRKNETTYRTRGDPISFFSKVDKALPATLYDPHGTRHLKDVDYSF